MIALNRILVPTDFSETSEVATTYGCELAEKFGASLHLLHEVSDADLGPGAAELWGFDPKDLLKRQQADAEKQLEELATKRTPAEMAMRTGTPFVEITRYAREQAIDMIVMGTHGRGAIKHLLLGSVAEHVVRVAPCPVLTVRHPEHEFVLP